jgi:DNA-binding CsgD family transcriptional regulator
MAGEGLHSPITPTALLERDSELDSISAVLDTARAGSGRVLVFEGHLGLGKSQLVSAARGFARGTGMQVLSAHGSELERHFPFGAALQLFEPRLAAAEATERELLTSGAAALTDELFHPDRRAGGRGGSLDREEEVFALMHGLYWLTANLADRMPLLIAVDDAHWMDGPTLRFLHYLAQRLAGLPVAVTLARRPDEGRERDSLLDALATHPAATVRRLRPLSAAAAGQLVWATFPHASNRFCRVCAEVTSGNPLYLRELLAAAAARGIEPTDEGAVRARGLGPESVSRIVLLRLSHLQFGATALARAAAVLGDGAPRSLVAQLAGLEPAVAADAADALAGADVLVAGDPVAFVHPIVRAAVYAELPSSERSWAHAEAARLLHAAGEPGDRVAAHLLEADPRVADWVVEVLRSAAARALARGAPESAIRFLRRALVESPPPEERTEILLELGRADAVAGNPRAVERFESALAGLRDPSRRAEVRLALGRTLHARGAHTEAAATFERGLDELGDATTETALRMEAGYVAAAREELALRPLASARVQRIMARANHADSPGERVLLADVAYERALRGDPATEVAEQALTALQGGALLAAESADESAPHLAAMALAWAGEFEAATEAATAAIADARSRGSVFAHATACQVRALTGFLAGRVGNAMADAQTALDALPRGDEPVAPLARALLARLLLERGEPMAARGLLSLFGGDEVWTGRVSFAAVLESRGWLAIAEGDADEALANFLECGRRQAAARAPNPAVRAWRSGAAIAAAMLDDVERASRLAREEIELAQMFGAPGPIGAALRTAGLVIRGDEGLDLLRDAVQTLERSAAELEHARALTDLGGALRRAGKRSEAQDTLRRAMDLAYRCGAPSTLERARAELTAAGARPRRAALTGFDALTAGERRVTELALEGLTNREIAQALFVTVKTVEWHLGNTYGKLGISSRRDLKSALTDVAA